MKSIKYRVEVEDYHMYRDGGESGVPVIKHFKLLRTAKKYKQKMMKANFEWQSIIDRTVTIKKLVKEAILVYRGIL